MERIPVDLSGVPETLLGNLGRRAAAARAGTLGDPMIVVVVPYLPRHQVHGPIGGSPDGCPGMAHGHLRRPEQLDAGFAQAVADTRQALSTPSRVRIRRRSPVAVAIGAPIADPIIGLAITCMILWDHLAALGHRTSQPRRPPAVAGPAPTLSARGRVRRAGTTKGKRTLTKRSALFHARCGHSSRWPMTPLHRPT